MFDDELRGVLVVGEDRGDVKVVDGNCGDVKGVDGDL